MQKIINSKRLKLFLLAALTLILLLGCSSNSVEELSTEETGQLKVNLNLDTLRDRGIIAQNILDGIEVDKIEVEISNGGYSDSEVITDLDEEIELAFNTIPAGSYTVSAKGIESNDENEYVIYKANKEISIEANATTEAELGLKINTATLTVVFPDIEEYRDSEQTTRLILDKFLKDSIEETFAEDDGEEWRVEIPELQAERWDLKIKVEDNIIASQEEYEFLPGREYHLFAEVEGDNLILEDAIDLDLSYPDISEVEVNQTLMQTFYWEMNENVVTEESTEINYADDYPEEANLWNLLADRAGELSDVGITSLWLPPASKAFANNIGDGREVPADVGYGVYDLWDLGEFDQKDTVRTKYGTKDELEGALSAIHDAGMEAYFDIVFNHRMGADYIENVNTQGHGEIEAWTGFDFEGRNTYYTQDKWDNLWHDFKWNQNEYGVFTAVDWDARGEAEGVFLFEHKQWGNVTHQDDYLMGANVDYYSGDWKNEKVIDEMKAWGEWIINDIGFDGFRMDATAHIDNRFISEWVKHVQDNTDKDVFFVAEAWIPDVAGYLQDVDEAGSGQLDYFRAFDFGLRDTFGQLRDGDLDLRNLNNAGLSGVGYGHRSVTFLDNHDTNRDEPNDYNQTPINNRANQAYTYILTRKHSIPTIFWKDYYQYGMKDTLDKLISARRNFAYGEAYEYGGNTEGVYVYTRAGLDEVEGTGLVMLISDYEDGSQAIMDGVYSGRPNTIYIDYTGNVDGIVETDNNGYGDFKVNPDSWSVWVPVHWNEW
ncbi:alpha-amylase domain-containing protein [Halonatronum saccharophilum]|uniref:alpha-amylase domain-containing protein n=1 Tax=Halonatronum saccharophilum TaxID=150060 RepID=UPI0004B70C5D|nr:alpha-amylase domain-containing protein [Halonatronum saccharophilum]